MNSSITWSTAFWGHDGGRDTNSTWTIATPVCVFISNSACEVDGMGISIRASKTLKTVRDRGQASDMAMRVLLLLSNYTAYERGL